MHARSLENRIRSAVEAILPDITGIRHCLHRTPELADHEHHTSALIRRTLAGTRIDLLKPFLGTDVVGILKGRRQGPNITLRADIDALPMQEGNRLPYASRQAGCMHACGHDGHTAMLLGTARVLEQFADEFNGSVRFIFQPGEEVVARGRDLVARGALKNPTPTWVFALHGRPGCPEGVIASRPGALMAAAGFFTITIHGRGAHGSRPDQAIDPILVGARIVEALNALPREATPFQAPTLSICRFAAGTNGNIIPATAQLEGTLRFHDERSGKALVERMRQITRGVSASMGATARFRYREPYIPTLNEAKAVAVGQRVANHWLGKDAWMTLAHPDMGAEDFAFYLHESPGAMFWLGLGEKSPGLHHPEFDFNDDVIRTGMLFLIGCALDTLKKIPG